MRAIDGLGPFFMYPDKMSLLGFCSGVAEISTVLIKSKDTYK
jgi:hypothetical protein